MLLRITLSILLLEISSLAVGNCDGAGKCYVSIIATGSGSGADWTNACTDFTGACDVTNVAIRGTTIYVGGSPGNPVGPAYQVKHFSAPASGTTPITIIGASAANHGTDVGWRRQSATAVVPFVGPVFISTDYWTFNGQFRARNINQTQSQGGGTYHDQFYGYHMQFINPNKTTPGGVQITGNHVILEYVYIQGSATPSVTGTGTYGQTGTDNGIYYGPGVHDEYLGYSWIGFTGADSISANSGQNFIFEYNLFSKNHMGPASLLSEAISIGNISNLIIRYNHFYDILGRGILADPNTDATAFTPNWYFYGNDIFWDTAVHTGTGYGLTGGLVNLLGETLNGGVIHVYFNTIAGVNNAACGTVQSCISVGLFLNGTTGGNCATHTQNCIGATAPVGEVLNTLWWDPFQAINVFSNTAANPQWTPTGDFGEADCLSTGCSNNGQFFTTGPNDFRGVGSVPFKSFNGVMGGNSWYNFNFLLVRDNSPGIIPNGAGITPPGCNIAFNCEATDPNMVTRGADGNINRGAFQINSRVLLSVGVVNEAIGLHIGSTFQEVAHCTWSSAPTSDNCPDQNPPFVKQWVSLDNSTATISSTGVVTGVSNHNAFMNLFYGGLTSDNSIIVLVTDGQGTEPIATLPNGIVRTSTPIAFSGYDTTTFDINFPTTYSLPTGGHQWNPTTGAELISDLRSSAPGDVIVLQAGTIYSSHGFFPLPARSNPTGKWTYIISSAEASLPPQGTRVKPSDAINMPKVVSLGGNSLFVADPGADHWWISGVEMYSQSNNGGCPTCNPPSNPSTYALVITNAQDTPPSSMPDSITIDRCYLHNDPQHDIFHIIMMNASHFAVLDSIAMIGSSYEAQAQADTMYFNPGPIKIINNLFSAFGEDSIMGGAGGESNMWVLRDAYFHHNTYFKNPAYRAVGVTIPPLAPYNQNNNFELKICQRCLVDGNIMNNSWAASQEGGAIVLNAGTGANGADATISDITLSNNIITGSLQGVGSGSFAAVLNGCGQYNSPCQYPGENRRNNYFNNLYVMGPQGPPGGRAFIGGNSQAAPINRLTTDYIYQHNTFVGPYLTDHVYCDDSFFFNPVTGGGGGPTDLPPTQNLWILDNVLCRQMKGASPLKGTALLNLMMGDPSSVPVSTRFYGNVMQVFTSQGDTVDTYPPNNINTTSNFTYVSPSTGNYQLQAPTQIGSDGKQSGIDYTVLMAHQAPALGNCSISGTVHGNITSGVAITVTGDFTGTVYANPNGTYSFPGLAAGNYTVTPLQLGYAFSPPSATVSNQTCVTGSIDFASSALPTYTISGTITQNSAPLGGVTVRMSGEGTGTQTTDANGNYSFTGLLINSGNYVITPSLTGHTFSPVNATIQITNASVVQNFSATATGTTFSITGSINGATLSGVTLALSGAANATATSNTAGAYIFNGLANGNYTITPSKTGFIFSPTSTPVTIAGANVTGVNFTATQVINRFTISGQITGVVFAGILVNLSGTGSGQTFTDSNGNYAFTNLVAGNYIVAPSLIGHTFSPTSISIMLNNNSTGNNFVSTLTPGTGWIVGRIGPTVTKKKATK